MSQSRPDRLVRRGGVLLALAVFSTACQTHDAPGVTVRGQEVNVTFGVKPKPLQRVTGVKPSGVVGQAPAAGSTEDDGFISLPPSALPDIDLPDGFSAGPIRVENCPDALENAIVQLRADAFIPQKRRPPMGDATWAITGTVDDKPLPKLLEERQLRDVNEGLKTPDVDQDKGETFSWSVTEPETGGGYVRYDYAVKSKSLLQGQEVYAVRYPVNTGVVPAPIGPLIPPAPFVYKETFGAPDRGVVLAGVEHFDAQGSSIDRFSPPVGLLLLPLDVVVDTHIVSRAIDPNTQKVWTYDATVSGRRVVDACGSLIQGWLVKGTLTTGGVDSAGSNAGTQFDVVVAPQYGGMIISERRVEKIDGKVYDRTFTLGSQPSVVEAP